MTVKVEDFVKQVIENNASQSFIVYSEKHDEMVHELRFLFRHCGHILNEGTSFLSVSELQDMIMNLQSSVIVFSHANSLTQEQFGLIEKMIKKNKQRFILCFTPSSFDGLERNFINLFEIVDYDQEFSNPLLHYGFESALKDKEHIIVIHDRQSKNNELVRHYLDNFTKLTGEMCSNLSSINEDDFYHFLHHSLKKREILLIEDAHFLNIPQLSALQRFLDDKLCQVILTWKSEHQYVLESLFEEIEMTYIRI